MSDNLAQLYEKYNILSDAKEKVSQHSKEYLDSFEGIKGNENEKMLAAQILSKFFKYFPSLQDKALNAILDLCEDDEARIRACAMRYLVQICKDCKQHISKVTDILAQMMQMEDQKDYSIACGCLLQLSKEDPVNVLKTLYNHIHTLGNPQAREKCVEFIHKKLVRPIEEQSQEIENIVIEESKKLIPDATCDEIVNIISCLVHSKFAKTPSGQQELIEIIGEVIEFNQEFDPLDDGAIGRIIMCVNYIMPLFSTKNESTKFIIYYCDQILPQFDKIKNLEHGDKLQLELLKQLAEMSTYCGKLDNPSLHVVQIFDKIKNYMPQPPEDVVDVEKMPNFEFSFVECLLYAFHRLARQCPDFLTHDESVLKDFRQRLQYFSRGVQGCNKVLNNTKLKNLEPQDANKTKIMPQLLTNLNMLIKDLFFQPPMYKCNVTLSFKSVLVEKDEKKSNTSNPQNPQKRHVPITFEGGNEKNSKQSRSNRSGDNIKLYQPPSGKFSNNFSYDRGGRGGRSRARGRGRGGPGRWRN